MIRLYLNVNAKMYSSSRT